MIPTNIKASNSAFAYAQKLRNTNHIVRVEIDLKMRTPDEIRNYALEEGISYLAWVDENGNAKIETAN